MSAYLVITARITEPGEFMEYAKKAAALLEKMGGKYLVRGSQTNILEGDVPEDTKIVVSKWPSREAALAFWNSPEYREIAQIRKGKGVVTVVLVEGTE